MPEEENISLGFPFPAIILEDIGPGNADLELGLLPNLRIDAEEIFGEVEFMETTGEETNLSLGFPFPEVVIEDVAPRNTDVNLGILPNLNVDAEEILEQIEER